MKEKNLICRISRRMEALFLAVVMLVTAVTIPVSAQEIDSGEQTFLTLVESETVVEKTVIQDSDAKAAIADQPFLNNDHAENKEVINNALSGDGTLAFQVGITVNEYTPESGETPQIVIYAMNFDTQVWKQAHHDIVRAGETYYLSLNLQDYEKIDLLGLRIVGCTENSTVKYTIHNAELIEKITVFGGIGTQETGVVSKNPDGTDYIVDKKLADTKEEAAVGEVQLAKINHALEGDGPLALKVGVTVDEYSSKGTAQVVVYAMDYDVQDSWKQVHYDLAKKGDTCELVLDLKDYEKLDLLGVRIVGCDEGSTVKYTVNYAEVVEEEVVSQDPDEVTAFEGSGTKVTGVVSKNPEGDDYIADKVFADTKEGAVIGADELAKINHALGAGEPLALKVGITVDEYSSKGTAQVVVYAMDYDVQDSWKQVHYDLTKQGDTCELVLDLKDYEKLDLLGVRIVGCDEGSTVEYTVNYAEVVREEISGEEPTPTPTPEPSAGTVADFAGNGTKVEGTVIANPDGADYFVDKVFAHSGEGIGTDLLAEINAALAAGDTLALEVGVTVNDYTCTSGKAPQIVAYAMDFDTDGSWKQVHQDILQKGDVCALSLDLSGYQKLDLLGVRLVGCDEGTNAAYTVNYARVVKKEAPVEEEGTLATLVTSGTEKTGAVEENPYAGENANSKYILKDQFEIPWSLKFGLEGFTGLKLQVGVTIREYSAEQAGTTDDDAAVLLLYAMDDTYGNWQQDQVKITEKPQTVDLELDLSGYEYLGEFGLQFGGFDPGSSIQYTINYARVIGEGESSASAEKIPLKYSLTGQTKDIPYDETPVGQHGKLSVQQVSGYSAPTIVDKNGQPYQLRGASTHGLSWFPNYVNKTAFQNMRDEWGMNLIRIAVYAREGDYAYVGKPYSAVSTEEARAYNDNLIQKGVEAAKELGMYVILDWHVLNYNPNEDKEAAKEFFAKYVEKYKTYDNVLFEICNEPTGTEWYDGSGNDLYSYCKDVTGMIRNNGSDAIVICGTNQYSSEIDKVAEKPLSEDGFTNIMYTCHFYAASHREDAQQKLLDALAAGVPAFISEYGICTASGDGRYDTENADKWLGICDKNNVSYACWAISNSQESAAYFKTDCNKVNGWVEEDLTNTSRYIINYYRARQEGNVPCSHTKTEIKNGKDATCTEDGYTGDTYCVNCKALLKKGSAIEKTGHVWDGGTVTKPATETETGVKTFTCKVCQETKIETIAKLEGMIDFVEDGNHTFQGTVGKDPNGTDLIVDKPFFDGTAGNNMEWINQMLKDGADLVLEAGITVNDYTCTTGKTPQVVLYAASDKGDPLSWSKVAYNLTKKGESCELSLDLSGYTKIDLLGLRIVNCDDGTEVSYTIDYARLKKKAEDPSCKHTEKETRGNKAATCKEEGYTGDIYCKSCGTLLERGSVIAKTAHSWNAGIVTKPATALADGVKTFTCTVCGTIRTEAVAKIGLPKKGTILKSGKNSYKVVKEGTEVAFVKTTNKTKKITIPATVKIGGITYKVTQIGAKALKGNKKVTTVKIGKNVAKIGKFAFYNCKALKKITIPAKVQTIGASAFNGCKKLQTITVKSSKLKSVGKNAFRGIKSNAKIKVPAKKLKRYQKLLKKKGQSNGVKITK